VTVSRDAIRTALAAFRSTQKRPSGKTAAKTSLPPYNTLEVIVWRDRVHYLYEMLEGQVAVLSSASFPQKIARPPSRATSKRPLPPDQYSYISLP
jgi:hypothetical protein